MLQALLESIKKSQSHTPYLFAGLPVLFVIFSFFISSTTLNCSIRSFQLDSMYNSRVSFQQNLNHPSPLQYKDRLLPTSNKFKSSNFMNYQEKKKKSLRSLRLNLFRTTNSIRRGRLLFFFLFIYIHSKSSFSTTVRGK